MSVPTDPEYQKAVDEVLTQGLLQLDRWPEWKAKFEAMMIRNMGATDVAHSRSSTGKGDRMEA